MEHIITITDGTAPKKLTLKPEQRAENVCAKTCTVKIEGDDDEWQLEASDIVVIEDGYLYYDEPDAPPPAGTPPGAQPAPQAKPKG